MAFNSIFTIGKLLQTYLTCDCDKAYISILYIPGLDVFSVFGVEMCSCEQ